MSTPLDSQSFYDGHHDGEVSLYPNQQRLYGPIAGSLLPSQLPGETLGRIESVYEELEDQDQTEVTAVEKLLLGDFGQVHASTTSGDCAHGASHQADLQWYYFLRISPDKLNPADIKPTYNTTDNFQLHAWIMADGDMGSSITSNNLFECLPLGRDNVDRVEHYLDDYLQDYLDQDIGTRLWVYFAMSKFKDHELEDIMRLQVDQIRLSLTKYAVELSVTVEVMNYEDWLKGR